MVKRKDGDLETLLGVVFDAGEAPTPSAADPDWEEVAPSETLLEQTPQAAESLPVLPVVKGPHTVFDETYDSDLLHEYRARAHKYKTMTGRFDPFDVDRMRKMLEGAHYSTFLQRPILTFKDALDHSIQICLFWADEDGDLDLVYQTGSEEASTEPQEAVPNLTGKKSEQLEEARIAWRNACAQRNKIVQEWNDYVAVLRVRYQSLKTESDE